MVGDTIELLRAALKRPGFTKRGLARMAGIHPNTLLGCEDDSWNPKSSTLLAIEPYLPKLEAEADIVDARGLSFGKAHENSDQAVVA